MNKITRYADDTNVLVLAGNMLSLIHEAEIVMNVIKGWLDSNKIILNLKKAKCVLFRTKRSNLEIDDLVINFHGESVLTV